MSRNSSRSFTPSHVKTKLFTQDIDHTQDNQQKQVAQQLTMIRKRHDKTKQSNLKKRKQLDQLQKDISKANQVLVMAQADQKLIQTRYDNLLKSLEQTQKKHQNEINSKKTYLHMLDRMRKQKISMQRKTNSLQQSLKSAKHVLQGQTERFRRIRQNKYQSRLVLQGIRSELQVSKRMQNQRLQQLSRNVQIRKQAGFRREERQKRQAEIAEAAANDDKDSHQIKLRDTLFLHRFWHQVLSKRLEVQRESSVVIQDAYQKIRAATGMVDQKEIVEKFLTREQTYSQLQKAVERSEMKLDQLRLQNRKAREKLEEIYIEEEAPARKMYSEIQKMEKELQEAYKEFGKKKEKLEKSTRNFDQVFSWGQKIMKMLDIPDTVEPVPIQELNEQNNPLPLIFSLIYEKLVQVVKPIQDNLQQSRKVIEQYQKKTTEELIQEMNTPQAVSKLRRFRQADFSQNEAEQELPIQRTESVEATRRKKFYKLIQQRFKL